MEHQIHQSDAIQQLTRVEQIVRWLSRQRDIAGPLSDGSGFFINKGKIIRLKNGERVEALEWLNREDISDGKRIFGYRIKLLPAKNQYNERLIFFKDEINAPF